jgi:hypothetical protein
MTLEDPHTVRLSLAPAFTFAEPDAAGPIILTADRALPWDVEVPANGWGDVISFAPGAVNAAELDPSRVKLLLDHRPKPFGYGIAAVDDGTALGLRMAIPRDELADPEIAAAVRQMRNGVRDAVSVGVDLVEFTSTPVDPADRSFFAPERIRVTGAELLELSSVIVPRFAEARHAPLAAHRPSSGDPMPPTVTAARTTPTEPDPPDPDDPTTPDPDDARLEAHRTATAVAQLAAVGVQIRSPGPLARFTTFAEYARARLADPTVPDLSAAWVDQITTDNPGVMQPTWVSEVKGIVDLGRPFVTALGGGASAGDSGMELSWPYFDGDLTTLVGEQAVEKTEITSVKVSLKKATEPLRTFAGGSDISLQLIERSSPSYLDAYLRIMTAAYAAVTNRAAVIDAQAASTAYVVVDLLTASADVIAGAIFEASVKVQTATGLPASVVACGTDVFPKVAAAVLSLQAPRDNTAGAAANAATLRVDLAGLVVTHDPFIAATTAIVTNRAAYQWHEDGPRTISAPDVAKLGRDVAVYGYGGSTAYTPAGIVELTPTVPVAEGSSTSSRSSKSSK